MRKSAGPVRLRVDRSCRPWSGSYGPSTTSWTDLTQLLACSSVLPRSVDTEGLDEQSIRRARRRARHCDSDLIPQAGLFDAPLFSTVLLRCACAAMRSSQSPRV